MSSVISWVAKPASKKALDVVIVLVITVGTAGLGYWGLSKAKGAMGNWWANINPFSKEARNKRKETRVEKRAETKEKWNNFVTNTTTQIKANTAKSAEVLNKMNPLSTAGSQAWSGAFSNAMDTGANIRNRWEESRAGQAVAKTGDDIKRVITTPLISDSRKAEIKAAWAPANVAKQADVAFSGIVQGISNAPKAIVESRTGQAVSSAAQTVKNSAVGQWVGNTTQAAGKGIAAGAAQVGAGLTKGFTAIGGLFKRK